MTVNQAFYFGTLIACTSPTACISNARVHAQLSVLYGESPAFYPPFTLKFQLPPPLQKLSKESFQKGTTFGPQRCLNY